jgi:putative spermidine/putrescine transport system ATP-binding protein
VVAVNSLDLDIPAGNLVALLGPSGCGKTTTLKMIAGLIEPDNGDITFDGESVLEVPVDKRNVGMVFQRYVLFPHMNVFDNVAFGLKMRKVPKDELKRRVDEVLGLVQLQGFEKRHPAQLSGGQMQRVAIARAVVTNPTLMLMDEPLANLDAKLRLEMREFIRSLQRRLQITTIFVTHDQSEAAVLADTVAVMFDGKIHQFDKPRALFTNPESWKVAEFLGATNFLQGVVKRAEAGTCIVESPLGECMISVAQDVNVGDEVMFVIRPEHVEINYCNLLEPSGDNTYRAEVHDVIYEGGLVKYFVKIGDQMIQVHDRSTRFLTDAEELSVFFDTDRLWIIPQGGMPGEG